MIVILKPELVNGSTNQFDDNDNNNYNDNDNNKDQKNMILHNPT